MSDKVPMRLCTACRQMKDKKSLFKIVRSLNDKAEIDFLYRMEGRGAYICKSKECVELAKKRKSIDRALSIEVDNDIYERLLGEC